jgi:hypothetical protein
MDAGEMSDLRRLFQQRHLLAHCEGIVDQEYIDKSGDQTYAVGQRLVIKSDAVGRLLALLEKLSTRLAGLASRGPAAGGPPSASRTKVG